MKNGRKFQYGEIKEQVWTWENDGPFLVATNYFETDAARKGALMLSINAGAFRLLVPQKNLGVVHELNQTEIVVSRGPWREVGLADGIEILFDDHSVAPYAIHLQPAQCVPLPAIRDANKYWEFLVYTCNDAGDGFELAYRGRAWFRSVPRIPWMAARLK